MFGIELSVIYWVGYAASVLLPLYMHIKYVGLPRIAKYLPLILIAASISALIWPLSIWFELAVTKEQSTEMVEKIEDIY